MSKDTLHASRRAFMGAGAVLLATAAAGQSGDTIAESKSMLGVSTIADALRQIGRDPMSLSMTTDIRPQTPVGNTFVGPAVTTEWRAGLGRMSGDDVRKYMFEPLDAAASGSVWVVAGGTERMLSLFGGVIGIACKRNGMRGVVTDNACRDMQAFADIDLPVFAKATVPFGPADFVRPVAANETVRCGGVEVNPGDYVAADIDGVIVIPQGDYDEVIAATADILAKESKVLEKIEAGESLASAYTI